MIKLRSAAALFTTGVMVISMAGCGGSADTAAESSSETSAETSEESYTIGIIKQMDHVALNNSEEGFVDALADNGLVDGENLTIDYENGQGDTNNLATIADQFVADNVDLVFAIATNAAQAVAGKTTDIPIVGTAITSYTEAALVDSDEVPGGNVTGTTDMNPVEEQINLIAEVCPDVETIGFLYCSNEANSILQVEMAKEACEALGYSTVEQTVSSTNEVQQATQNIVTECDAIYIPTDNVFASSMALVDDVATPAGIPVFCGESGMVMSGGFATLGISYYSIGYQTGLMAVDILLNGADPAEMAIQGSAEFEYCFNGETADALGIEIPEKYADSVQYSSDEEADETAEGEEEAAEDTDGEEEAADEAETE
ncbi:MAG: ABC transporter substrate-binding protein [Clostridiales bacterium]|nr:ABC transporter substrate-binding protein [Clostridiales bacterium]